ncbi:hypothetical protein ABTY53_15395 [Streptomyces noursei]|uniref:hypothetical protein n=1 Tax=Streptomyces noursei TaxID=1971 RepID=UPI00332E30F7
MSRRILVDIDELRIRPGDRVTFPAVRTSGSPSAHDRFILAGIHPDEPHMVLITDLRTDQCHRVAPAVIGARFVTAIGDDE